MVKFKPFKIQKRVEKFEKKLKKKIVSIFCPKTLQTPKNHHSSISRKKIESSLRQVYILLKIKRHFRSKPDIKPDILDEISFA